LGSSFDDQGFETLSMMLIGPFGVGSTRPDAGQRLHRSRSAMSSFTTG